MIVSLRGELLENSGARVVLDVAGVGYDVAIPASMAHQLPPVGMPVQILVRHVFREDGQYLFGFLTPLQRTLFDLLTEAKGCGPKISLALLGELGAEGVIAAIQAQDLKMLCRTPGVGARLAERILVELKDKVNELQWGERIASAATQSRTAPAATPDSELVEALLALGYRRNEAEHAAQLARSEADSVEEQLKLALRSLKK